MTAVVSWLLRVLTRRLKVLVEESLISSRELYNLYSNDLTPRIYYRIAVPTSSSAVAKRPRDASC